MSIGICPRCHQNYAYNEYDSDFVHTCNSTVEALDKEDILKTDEANATLQGIENKAVGNPKFEGERIHDINVFGHIESTHKTRQHYEYITLK